MWYEILSMPARLLVALILFFFGGTVASAVTCLFDRLRTGESWVRGHSHCNKCGHKLAVIDLIPVVSYELAQGHCRYCGQAIPRRYRDEEAMLGVIFIVFYIVSPTIILLISTLLAFIATYILCNVFEFEHRENKMK